VRDEVLTADPGPWFLFFASQQETGVPGLQRTTPLRCVLHCARDTVPNPLRHRCLFLASSLDRTAGTAIIGLGHGARGQSMSTAEEVNALLMAVPRGDAGAFERLYEATCAKLYGVVLRILRRQDLSAEVMDAAYLQIWSTAADFDPRLFGATAWMVAIARRLAIDRARQPAPEAGDGEAELDDNDGPGAVPRREITDELKRLLTCIGRLDPNRQRMLLLAYYGAFSRDQLAVKLDVGSDDVKLALRTSLSEIEQCLTS
jgi:RNA polymerase sigma-70 factor, ECF subfamily